MNRLYIIALVVISTIFVGCQTDVTNDNQIGGNNKLTLSISSSRTSLGEKVGDTYPTYWSEDDKVAVNGNASIRVEIDADNSSKATFEFDKVISYPYNITYPYCEATSAEQPIVVLPTEQSYIEGSFSNGSAPMCGYATDGNNIAIKHLASVMRIPIKSAVEGVILEKIVVSSPNKIAGEFSVNCQNATISATANSANTITYSVDKTLATTEEDVFHIAIAAVDAGACTVELFDSNGDKMTATWKANTVKAGKIYEFKALIYNASTTCGLMPLGIYEDDWIERDGINLRFGTYNIWADSARQVKIDNEASVLARSWDNSKQAVANLIAQLNCDIIGMQEVSTVCRDDLANLVKTASKDKYELWWLDTYPSPKKDIGNAVFYDKKKFKFSDQGIYYFSETPEVPSVGWDETNYHRAALTAVVTHIESGKRFFYIATHGPLGNEANGHAGRLLVEFDKKYNTKGLPTIAVGDMNARPNGAFHQNMLTHYKDCYLVAEKKSGTIGTFNGASESDDSLKNESNRIDHIYVRSTIMGHIDVNEYKVSLDKLNCGGEMHYPSDHNPVIVDVTLR